MQHEKLIEALEAAGINGDDLLESLKSDTVYTALRYATKSPSSSGMDDYEDYGYYDLYNTVVKLTNTPTPVTTNNQ